MLLLKRSSKPPLTCAPAKPCAHSDAVDSSVVVSVGTLPKIGWMSSYGARKRPILNVPQLPCRPTNVSRPPSVPPPASHGTLFSSWKIADKPPPSDSVPRRPKRDEFVLTRNTVGFVVLHVLTFTQVVACGPPFRIFPLTNSISRFARP